jgi:hypothetical protein
MHSVAPVTIPSHQAASGTLFTRNQDAAADVDEEAGQSLWTCQDARAIFREAVARARRTGSPDWLVDSGKSVIVIELHEAVMARRLDHRPRPGSILTGEHLAAHVGSRPRPTRIP